MAIIAAALVAVDGPNEVAAQETQKSNSIKTGESKSEKDSATNTRKASCRCGKLSVTYNGPDPDRITLCHCNYSFRTKRSFSIDINSFYWLTFLSSLS